eukprot:161883_1
MYKLSCLFFAALLVTITAYIVIIFTDLAAAMSAIDSVASSYFLLIGYATYDPHFRTIFYLCIKFQKVDAVFERNKEMNLKISHAKEMSLEISHAKEMNLEMQQLHNWQKILDDIEINRKHFNKNCLLQEIERSNTEVNEDVRRRLLKLCYEGLEVVEEKKHDTVDHTDDYTQCIFCNNTMKTINGAFNCSVCGIEFAFEHFYTCERSNCNTSIICSKCMLGRP